MRGDRGQIGIIMLLLTVVMLTVGISVISRTSTDVVITERGEEASRVLDAAETGIEKALSDSQLLDPDTPEVGPQTVTVGNLEASYQVAKQAQFDGVVEQHEAITVDLRGATLPANATLNVAWGTGSTCNDSMASLVVTIYSQTGTPATTTFRRLYLAPCARTTTDGFTVVTRAGTGEYYTSYNVPLQAGDQVVRVRPVYGQTPIQAVGNGWTLPIQQFTVTSTATNPNSNETKAIEVDQSLPMAPSIFDFTLYSATTIGS